MNDIQQQPNEELDDQRLIYYFSSDWERRTSPQVSLTKSWPEGEEKRVVSYYPRFQEALDAEMEWVQMRNTKGLEATLREVERQSIEAGTLDPARADGRLFQQGPPDPFTTRREQELAGTSYTYDVVPVQPGSYQLELIKLWEVDGKRGMEALPLGQYDRIEDARAEQSLFQTMREQQGLEAEMQQVEKVAIENGSLNAQRADPRLFQQGPLDPFSTRRQQELDRNDGYFFRAGPVLDDEPSTAFSLNLMNVERTGVDYTIMQTEYLRTEDAGYIQSVARDFNRMLQDEGVDSSISAATTWARKQGSQVSDDWRKVDAARLEPGGQWITPRSEMDTEPIPPIPPREIDF
jgi:hypothetical protein